jgi:hypothetical protein
MNPGSAYGSPTSPGGPGGFSNTGSPGYTGGVTAAIGGAGGGYTGGGGMFSPSPAMSTINQQQQFNATGNSSSSPHRRLPKEVARTREVEQQIAYLRWKKMQNDREIKKAITVSRALKKKDAVLNYSIDKSTERFMWANSVVRDELQRPLVVSDAELHYLQHEEVKAKKKLEKVCNPQQIVVLFDFTLFMCCDDSIHNGILTLLTRH